MAVQALDFIYNNIPLSSFNGDYKLVSFETSPSDTDVEFIDNKVETSDIHYNSPISHFYYTSAKDLLTFDIFIAKRSGDYLTQCDVRELSGWLTSPVEPKVLSFIKYRNDDGTAVYEDLEYIGVFNKAKYAEMGQCLKMGIGFTFTNISSYAFSQIFTTTIENDSGGSVNKSIINTGTKTNLPIYPIIEIIPTDTGSIKITNKSNPNDIGFGINVTKDEPVIISNFNVYASDGSLYDFSNLTCLKFPCLLDGENVIEVKGKCTCNLSYRFYENIGV